MNNLFNLPFSFSLCPQTLKNLLQHRLNIQLDTNEDKWSEKAIKGLLKRLTKTSMINDLQTALDTKNSQTNCVTISQDAQNKLVEPNPSTTVQKAFNDITPVVAFCRIWRWPDLNTHLELRPVQTCSYAFQYEKDQICVNPYHYERIVAPSIPPIYVSIFDRSVFNSTTSEYCQNAINSEMSVDCLSSSSSNQQQTTVNSSKALPDITEAMTPISTTVDQIATKPIHYTDVQHWCSILYYELNRRVGDVFHASLNSFVIDGFFATCASDRFCLGSLSNVNRTYEIETCRKLIGNGVRLSYIGGEVFVECHSNSPIFVQSRCCNQRFNWDLATVCKIPPRCSLKIFSNSEFAQILSDRIPYGYEAVYNLTQMCAIRMSFVKGWGIEYRRRTVMSTPCWIEIHLNGPMKWLDNVLQQLPSPGIISSN